MLFAHPGVLPAALFGVLIVAACGARWRRRRRRAAAALADARLLRAVAPGLSAPAWRPALWTLAALLVGLAAAGPLVGREPAAARSTLADVVLVLDASNSMLVEDVRPNRLEVERRLARELLRHLQGTRVGLVVFAGQGYAVSPLTRDLSALEDYLALLGPEMVPQGGSSLSSALRQGGGLVGSTVAAGQPAALVLMTDGDALEEGREIEAVAALLAGAGIPVHTVGVGTPGGGRIPDVDPQTGVRRGFKREPSGVLARSSLGEALLRGLAERTGGSHTRAGPAGALRLAGAVRVSGRPRSWNESRPGNRYAWLLAAALLLLALDGLLAARPRGAGLLLLLLAAGCARTPQADYRAGRTQQAADRFGRRVARGDTSAEAVYNLATARLRLGEHASARGGLEAAARRAAGAELRFAAHFNAGSADLEPAVAAPPGDSAAAVRLRRAVARYRAALRLRPGDLDAKWNLELAERLLSRQPPPPPPPPPGPAEAAEQAPSTGAGGGGSSAGPGDPGLTREDAERILAEAEAEERAVQRRRLRHDRDAQPPARDW